MSEEVEEDEVEEQEMSEEENAEEVVIEVPLINTGAYLYVCAQCGYTLTEIPYYNRYYCENCGLHY